VLWLLSTCPTAQLSNSDVVVVANGNFTVRCDGTSQENRVE
jgi:hypothetical protein